MTTETKAVRHTPGPWTFARRTGPRKTTVLRDHFEVGQVQPPHHLVAIAFAPNRDGSEPVDANARLIAAAPDLLVEIERLVARFERCCMAMGNDPDIARNATTEARAAIAKATGGAR